MPDQEGHNPTPPNPNPLAPHGPLPGSSISRERNAAGRAFQPASAASSDATTIQPPTPITEAAGSRIGPYKLLQRIGEGGFGVVFLAQQDAPVRRKIALKIIKLGMDSRQVIARFEAERQALALMDHPHIARVIDGGTTAPSSPGGGRPYFVMEYVVGDSVIAFADAHRLDITARLDLFSQVCQAVQHAHQKGIIHRDLKPGNILASMVDGKPFARVIDFGIAKATGAAGGSLTDKTLFTEHRQLMGTPEYMSPEQAEGSPDIDTRTDIYALGVLLYELLTGLTPFDGARLRSAPWGEMQRIIREEEPLAPSLRLSRSLPTVAAAAAARHTEPGALAGRVRGELDWIVLKAIDKDRARRYETANQFAADVQRHLAGEAVVAAPPSAAYRVRKFVKRNKGVVIGASAVAAALLVGTAGTTWGLVLADHRQRETATANKNLAEQTDAAEWSAYTANLALAQQAMQAGQFPEARKRLEECPNNKRGWEWQFAMARAEATVLFVPGTYDAAWLSDENTLVLRKIDTETMTAFALDTGKSKMPPATALDPAAPRVAISSGYASDHPSALSPDESRRYGIDGLARSNHYHYSADRSKIVGYDPDRIGSAPGVVLDAATGAELFTFDVDGVYGEAAAFSRDGSKVIVLVRPTEDPHSYNEGVHVLSVRAAGGAEARLAPWPEGFAAVQLAAILDTPLAPAATSLATPDGTRRIVGESDRTVRFFDTKSDPPRQLAIFAMPAAVTELQMSADGTRLCVTLADDSARVWDIRDPSSRLNDAKAKWAERGPASGYVEALWAGTTPTDKLYDALVNDAALSPLRRVVVAELLRKHLGDLDYQSQAVANRLSVKHIYSLSAETRERDTAAITSQHRLREALMGQIDSMRFMGTMFGVVLYRAGAFKESLAALTRTAALSANEPRGDQPVDWAFIAMAHWQLGQKDEARAALVKFRELAAKDEWKADQEVLGWLQEAEALITPVP